MELQVEMDLKGREKISGIFENYVNNEAAPSRNPLFTKFIDIVNQVVSKHQMNCKWAGSQSKKTQVHAFSDADIWIETHGRSVSLELRIQISDQIISACMNDSMLNQTEPKFKFCPVATQFTLDTYSIDLVFSLGDWIQNESRVIPPNIDDFYMKGDRQRAVKALKLLSREKEEAFPKIQGMRLERLVLLAARSVDENFSDHVEKSSGLLLFRTCLYIFAMAKTPLDVIRAVSEVLPPPSAGDEWRMSDVTFEKWRLNCAFILASMHALRGTDPYYIFMSRLKVAMDCNEFTSQGRTLKLDHLNRICFAT